MSDSNSSLGTWIRGILGTILTGLILWWLTGPLSPFVHKAGTDAGKAEPPSSSSGAGTTEKDKTNTATADPVPEQKIIVEASPKPYTITAGEQAEIDVMAYTNNQTPIAGAKVKIQAGGGFFSISGNYVELGITNSNGTFKTYWKSPDPAASAYGMVVTVSKDGFISGSHDVNVITVNH